MYSVQQISSPRRHLRCVFFLPQNHEGDPILVLARSRSTGITLPQTGSPSAAPTQHEKPRIHAESARCFLFFFQGSKLQRDRRKSFVLFGNQALKQTSKRRGASRQASNWKCITSNRITSKAGHQAPILSTVPHTQSVTVTGTETEQTNRPASERAQADAPYPRLRDTAVLGFWGNNNNI